MNGAMQQFLIACNLICEGNRTAAATHLKAAISKIDRCKNPDKSIRADIVALLHDVERNVAKVTA